MVCKQFTNPVCVCVTSSDGARLEPDLRSRGAEREPGDFDITEPHMQGRHLIGFHCFGWIVCVPLSRWILNSNYAAICLWVPAARKDVSFDRYSVSRIASCRPWSAHLLHCRTCCMNGYGLHPMHQHWHHSTDTFDQVGWDFLGGRLNDEKTLLCPPHCGPQYQLSCP